MATTVTLSSHRLATLEKHGKFLNLVNENVLVVATLVATVVGILIGMQFDSMSDHVLMWLGLPGELYLRIMNAVVVPLVVCMVITCTSRLEFKLNWKIAVVAMSGVAIMHGLAVINAIIMFHMFKPELGPEQNIPSDGLDHVRAGDTYADLLRNLFTDSVVGAAIQRVKTAYRNDDVSTKNGTFISRELTDTKGTNIIGLLLISTIVGIASSKSLSSESVFLRFFRQAEQLTFTIIRWIFWFTPIGVFSMVAISVANIKDQEKAFQSLWHLVAAAQVGFLIHVLVVLPVIFYALIRKNPFWLYYRCYRPFFIGVASSKRTVALPYILTSCDRCGINPFVSAFVIPLTYAVHADASALFIASSALILAQRAGHELSAGDISVIGTLSAVMGTSLPPVPNAAVVAVIIMLKAIQAPQVEEDIALLCAIEWLLDRCRTGVNIFSDAMVAAYTDAVCGKGGVRTIHGTLSHTQLKTSPDLPDLSKQPSDLLQVVDQPSRSLLQKEDIPTEEVKTDITTCIF